MLVGPTFLRLSPNRIEWGAKLEPHALEEFLVFLMREEYCDLRSLNPFCFRIVGVNRLQKCFARSEKKHRDDFQLRAIIAAIHADLVALITSQLADKLQIANPALFVDLSLGRNQCVFARIDVSLRQRPRCPMLADHQDLALAICDHASSAMRLYHRLSLPYASRHPKRRRCATI